MKNSNIFCSYQSTMLIIVSIKLAHYDFNFFSTFYNFKGRRFSFLSLLFLDPTVFEVRQCRDTIG